MTHHEGEHLRRASFDDAHKVHSSVGILPGDSEGVP